MIISTLMINNYPDSINEIKENYISSIPSFCDQLILQKLPKPLNLWGTSTHVNVIVKSSSNVFLHTIYRVNTINHLCYQYC